MKKKIDIESLERKSPYRVPDGYFEGLPLKIQSRTKEPKKASEGILITRMQIVWSMTAALAIFFIGWLWYPKSANDPTADQLLANIDSEDLIEYLYEEDISTDEILASVDQVYWIDEMSNNIREIIEQNLSEDELKFIL